MAFLLERFDIIKQNHDKTGLYLYHDTVGTSAADPSSKVAGNTIAQVIADGFFNAVADVLQVSGGLIYVTTTDGAGIYKVTQVYDATTKAAAVKVTYAGTAANMPDDGAITNAKLATDVKVGSLATLTTTAKASVVGAINEVNAKVATVQAASTASDVATLKTDFNTLLTKLKTAGLMASS